MTKIYSQRGNHFFLIDLLVGVVIVAVMFYYALH